MACSGPALGAPQSQLDGSPEPRHTGIAAALASNAGSVLEARVTGARTLGATDNQLRVAAQLGRTAKRGADSETEAAFGALLDGTPDVPRCRAGGSSAMEGGPESPGAAGAGACGCGSFESPRPT